METTSFSSKHSDRNATVRPDHLLSDTHTRIDSPLNDYDRPSRKLSPHADNANEKLPLFLP